MNHPITRKEFLTRSAFGGLGLLAGCSTVRPRRIPPDGILRHACIGVGGIGGADYNNLVTHPKIQMVALCDVDAERLETAGRKAPQARRYADWRELFAKEGDRIDSCNVSVPDHMHATIALAALRAGKNVYCQKPLAHDVAECRALARTARREGAVTQLGTQHAAGAGDRLAVHYLRAGVLGKIQKVILCSNRASGAVYRLAGPRPAQGVPPPKTLAWDLWLGTAPERPFAPEIYHPMKWRAWQDFGTGWNGDIGCHIFDAVWKGLGLTAPTSVVAEVQEAWQQSKERRADTWPQSNHITWIFPGGATTAKSELQVEWFDGDIFPPEDAQAIARSLGFAKYPEEAALVIGAEGALLLPHASGPRLYPQDKFQGLDRPDFKGPSHYHRFVDACLGGAPTESSFEQTGPMAEAIILGTVAVRVPGQVLAWDARRLRIPNSPEAERLLRRTYRKGWDVDLKV